MIDLNEEIRNDYLITKKQKKIWNIQIDLLMKLLEVCQKHNIKVFAVCGTLLGAIRHNGFIPWDDDIDMGLLRSDYNKLLDVAEDEFKDLYFLQTTLNEKEYYSGVARLRNSNTTGIVITDLDKNCNNGIYIDIFPFDGINDNFFKKNIHFILVSLMRKITSAPRNINKFGLLKRIIAYIISKIVNCFGYNNVFMFYQKLCAKYSLCDTERVGIISGCQYSTQFHYYKNDLLEIKYVNFENILIPVPSGYERCLKINYGNYLELPPLEKRGLWHKGIIVFEPDVPYYDYIKRENSKKC